MRLKLIACEILYREISFLVSRSVNTIDIAFLTKGLHDVGRTRMTARLIEAVEAVDESRYDAILLGYALCNGGVVGLKAKSIPIVVPRAHDCITLFLGDRAKYRDYFFANPGTYFKTTGWIERGDGLVQSGPGSGNDAAPGFPEKNRTYEQLVAQYGEDNACYLREQLDRMKHYTKLAFIETGIEPDDRFEKHTEELARSSGWQYEKLAGDLSLLRRLIDGDWAEEDFLVIRGGNEIGFDYGEGIVKAVPPAPSVSGT